MTFKKKGHGHWKEGAVRLFNPQHEALRLSVLYHDTHHQRRAADGSHTDAATAAAVQQPGNQVAICSIMTFSSQLIDARTWKPLPDADVDKGPTCQTASPKSAGLTGEKWERKPKSQGEDGDEAALRRGILVQINSLIHLIRPFLIDELPPTDSSN